MAEALPPVAFPVVASLMPAVPPEPATTAIFPETAFPPPLALAVAAPVVTATPVLTLPPALERKMPPLFAVALAVCAVAFSAVTGVDYVRLDRDRAQFTAALDAVPRHATTSARACMLKSVSRRVNAAA